MDCTIVPVPFLAPATRETLMETPAAFDHDRWPFAVRNINGSVEDQQHVGGEQDQVDGALEDVVLPAERSFIRRPRDFDSSLSRTQDDAPRSRFHGPRTTCRAAALTDSLEVDGVAGDPEISPGEAGGNPEPQAGILDIGDRSANAADQVMVAAEVAFEAGGGSDVNDPAGQAHLHESLQNPVDSGPGNARNGLPCGGEELIDSRMVIPPHQVLIDDTPLDRQREAPLPAASFKFFKLAHLFFPRIIHC
jgi:hypothetical protein